MKFKDKNNEWQTLKVKNYGIEQTPIGSMIFYPSQTIPKGYLVCDGSEYLIADYPLLFNAIGYIGGEDVDTGYFRVPDMRGNVPAGFYEGLDASNPLAGNFGDKVGKPTHQLTIDEMPSHDHAIDWPNDGGPYAAELYQVMYSDVKNTWGAVMTTTQGTGGNQSHSIVQPTMLYHWLIKAKNVVTLGGYTEDFEITGDLRILGKIVMPTNKYLENGVAPLDMNNSDIINANGIYMNDECSDTEGINFLKQGGDPTIKGDYETLRGYRGNAYYNNIRLLTVDDLYYKAGDSTYLTGYPVIGHITSSTTAIAFAIQLPMRLDNVSNISITAGTLTVRGTAGYVGDSYNNPIPLTGGTYDIGIYKRTANVIHINVVNSTKWANVTNNTPVSVYLNAVTIRFS